MFFLPKINPLYEKISTSKVVFPEILEKLGKGEFTGYLNFSSSDFDSYCLFAGGRLLCAVTSGFGRSKSGFEAIALMFDKVLAAGGEINVYRMTSELAMCTHALMAGTLLFDGDEVRQVDIKGVLARMKSQNLNGVVLFYTAGRYAMMFYKDGLPVGFYHDGSIAVDSSPDEPRRVAALPGARIKVFSTKSMEELICYDLLQMVNLPKLWESAGQRRAALEQKEQPASSSAAAVHSEVNLDELVGDLTELAGAYLSRPGREIIARRLNEGGGPALMQSKDKFEHFLSLVESDARTVDDQARIEEMIMLMRSEVEGRMPV